MIDQLDRTDGAIVLQRCQMPAQEIRWVLAADDPNVVHMLLELHAERLREELAERLTALSEVEVSLTEAENGEGDAWQRALARSMNCGRRSKAE